MEFFIQQFLNGLNLGSMYALIAIGYTMVYGVLRLINFAHGDIMMVGAFSFFFIYNYSDSFLLSIFVSILFSIIIGIVTYKVAYKPLLNENSQKISLLISAIGVSFFLENLFNLLFGGVPKAFLYPDIFDKNIEIFKAITTYGTIFIIVTTFISLGAILFFLNKTRYGIAIKALAFDMVTVRLMGIDSNLLIIIVFIIGSFLACLGGVFYAMSYPSIEPLMGVLVGLKAFASAVLGGIGSVLGAAIGGFILGFSEILIVAFFPDIAGYKDAIAFFFLIFILLFKPSGIMGIDFEKKRF